MANKNVQLLGRIKAAWIPFYSGGHINMCLASHFQSTLASLKPGHFPSSFPAGNEISTKGRFGIERFSCLERSVCEEQGFLDQWWLIHAATWRRRWQGVGEIALPEQGGAVHCCHHLPPKLASDLSSSLMLSQSSPPHFTLYAQHFRFHLQRNSDTCRFCIRNLVRAGGISPEAAEPWWDQVMFQVYPKPSFQWQERLVFRNKMRTCYSK